MVVTASPLEVTVPDVHKFLNDTATLHEVDNMVRSLDVLIPAK